jgi:hypothetical protein
VTLGFRLPDDLLELKTRKELEKLAEVGAKSVHG